MNILSKIFGSSNSRKLKKTERTVAIINKFEEPTASLSDDELKHKADEFRQRYESGESLDAILPEAFAVVREASQRSIQLRPFDVQMIGGIVLHEGSISEMRTGEGKTLMATLPAYLNGLTGRGVHIVTVNDYLADRDANWMRPIYEFLGLSVGIIKSGQSPEEKKAAYQCSIIYGTNNEFGFDYLRDNMVFSMADKTQRGFGFAVVDEVDSILIDEARTPLIISGAAEDSSKTYTAVNKIIPFLDRGETNDVEKTQSGDFVVDENNVVLN